jgi:hypothetical protein
MGKREFPYQMVEEGNDFSVEEWKSIIGKWDSKKKSVIKVLAVAARRQSYDQRKENAQNLFNKSGKVEDDFSCALLALNDEALDRLIPLLP